MLIRKTPERRILEKVHRDIGLVNPKLRKLFRQLASGKARWPLFLFGPAGTGKTRAALCFCDFAAWSIYRTVEQCCDDTIQPGRPPIWPYIERCDVAVLDELGARERVGDLHYSVVKRFCDAREMHAERRAIYISNVGPDRMAEIYDDRIASRVLCGTWFELTGQDRRAI